MTPNVVFIVLFCVSSFLLTIPCIRASRSMCCISNLYARERFNRITYVAIFLLLSLIWNTLFHILTLFGNSNYGQGFDLFRITYAVEAITIILGVHTFRLLGFAFVEQLYANSSQIRPKWITRFGYFAEISLAICVFWFYSLATFIYHDIIWIYIFYIVLNIMLFILSIIGYIVVQKLLNMLNQIIITSDNESKIRHVSNNPFIADLNK